MKDWICGIAVGMVTGIALVTNPRVRKMANDAKEKMEQMKCCCVDCGDEKKYNE